MEDSEVMKLLLAAKVRDIAGRWRNQTHKESADFDKAVSEDPLDPYIDRVISELRRVASRF